MGAHPGDGTVGADAARASTLEADEVESDAGDDDLRRLLAAMDRLGQPHLAPGTQVGDYLVAARIGAGGMGVVYRARDRSLERDVALKLHARVDTDAGRARALREATAMARLSHPNVVTVFGVGSHGEHLYIAMEFVDGDDARTWQARGRGWREVVDLYLAAARGLAAAHGAGIVHRDFKPENVLVGRDGRVRVADFGLARSGADVAGIGPRLAAGSDSGVAGTPGYMAPEQFAWQAGPPADQFAFGIALAEALHGKRPVAGGAPCGDGVPPAIDRVIARAIAQAPGDRWPSMEAVIAALVRAARPRRRRTMIVVAAALVAVVAAALLIVRRTGPPWHPAIVEMQPQVDEDSDAPSVSPDGRTLAFASDAEQPEHYRVYVQPIDGGPRRALTPPEQAIAHSSVRWARDGAAVLAIDSSRGNSIVRIPVDGDAQTVLFDGRTFGFDDCGGRLVLIYSPPDCPGCSAIATVVAGAGPRELARIESGRRVGWMRCDPAGARAVYVDRLASTMSADVWMISLVDGARTRLTADGKNNLDPAFAADGGSVLYTSTRSGRANLWEQPTGGGAARALTTGAGPDLGPAPTPDGRRLLFDVDVTSVHLVAWQGGVRRALTTEVREILDSPAASPDGVHLAAIRSDGPRAEILLIDLAGGDQRVIAEGDHAGFSLDGRELLYTEQSPPRLMAVPVAGGAARLLAALPGPIEAFVVTGDGRVHLSVSTSRREAWSVGIAGGDLVRDADPPVALVMPGPAGARFQLVCPDTQPCDSLVEPGHRRLDATAAAWSADGSLYYCAHRDLVRLDVATGASTPLATGCRMGFALSPDGVTVYTGEYTAHVRRMTITNFGDR